jgi:hypothetical protein
MFSRQKTLPFKGRFASTDPVWALSSKSVITRSCARFPYLSEQNISPGMYDTQWAHRETVFSRFLVDDDVATRNPPICHHHRKSRDARCHLNRHPVGSMVSTTVSGCRDSMMRYLALFSL